jgi:aminopeptidase YwaD
MGVERYRDYMYSFADTALADIGPRGSCSAEEAELAHRFAREIEPFCDRVEVEEMECAPGAFLGAFPYLVALYAAGLAAYFFLPPLALALSFLGFATLFLEVFHYHEFIDFAFPKRKGLNVAGVISPRGEVKQRLIVSGHFDSAYEFKLWYYLKGLAVPYMALGVLSVLTLIGASLARTIAWPDAGWGGGAFTVLGIICLALLPLMLPFVFFHTRDLVPGAMDDLTAVAVLAGLGRCLREARDDRDGQGGFFPRRTEVVLLGLSSEEAGLRGAKRYADRHREEHRALPTRGIFLDGIYDESFLMVNRREISTGARLDPGLVEMARQTADAHGYPLKVGVIPLGATDASAFARAGVPCVSLGCADTSRLTPNYHTRHDTMEYVRPESLEVSLEMVLGMLERVDTAEA